MSDKTLLASLAKTCARPDFRPEPMAAACGVSVESVRLWARDNRLPKNVHVRAALEKWLAKNGTAVVR